MHLSGPLKRGIDLQNIQRDTLQHTGEGLIIRMHKQPDTRRTSGMPGRKRMGLRGCHTTGGAVKKHEPYPVRAMRDAGIKPGLFRQPANFNATSTRDRMLFHITQPVPPQWQPQPQPDLLPA